MDAAACITKCIISNVSGEIDKMMDSCNDPKDSAKGKGFCYYDKLQQCTTADKCSNGDYCVATISCDALHQQIVQDISTGVEDCITDECG